MRNDSKEFDIENKDQENNEKIALLLKIEDEYMIYTCDDIIITSRENFIRAIKRTDDSGYSSGYKSYEAVFPASSLIMSFEYMNDGISAYEKANAFLEYLLADEELDDISYINRDIKRKVLELRN